MAAKTSPPWLCEIKYRDDLRTHWREYKPRFKAARRYARQQGWLFRLITEREIRTPYLKNVTFLRHYRHHRIAQADRCRLLTVLAEHSAGEAETVLTKLSPTRTVYAQLLPVLWHLVAVGQIGVDLSVPLTMRSRLWLPSPTAVDSDG